MYKYRVRWIEAAAACPVFTALITYYVEGDRGHLLNVEQHRPERAYAVRGNAYSFHMPWEGIAEKLGTVLEEEDLDSLPHPPERLASIVLFSLRIGDVVDLNKWLPQAKLRPHVVLKLLFSLVDAKYPFKMSETTPERLKERFAELVARRYPEQEEHLPEDERDGTIPADVAKTMRASLRPMPGATESGMLQKHATPLSASQAISVALDEVRPSHLFPDRESFNLAPKEARELLALRKHYLLDVSTGKKLIEQWKNEYFALAFPFSIPRVVSGADFPRKERSRRPLDAPNLEPCNFAQMLAARVEASIRNDWLAVPSARNLATKWAALCGDEAACRHTVDQKKAGTELAAELSEAAALLYEKLGKGFWWDGRKRRKINHDVTKLPYAVDLTAMEKELVKDLTFLSGKFAGTQQIRLDIGHALFGARVEFGDPLFLTVSPSSRHSGMCIRLSRYRRSDPAITYEDKSRKGVAPWHAASRPRMEPPSQSTDSTIDVPGYEVRRVVAARDPWAVVQSFEHSVKYLLPRLLGLTMCPFCPSCNLGSSKSPCQNKFGHNMVGAATIYFHCVLSKYIFGFSGGVGGGAAHGACTWHHSYTVSQVIWIYQPAKTAKTKTKTAKTAESLTRHENQ